MIEIKKISNANVYKRGVSFVGKAKEITLPDVSFVANEYMRARFNGVPLLSCRTLRNKQKKLKETRLSAIQNPKARPSEIKAGSGSAKAVIRKDHLMGGRRIFQGRMNGKRCSLLMFGHGV